MSPSFISIRLPSGRTVLLNMDDEKLIKCVRKYPALYDKMHSKYLDTNYKMMLWNIIAEELKLSDETCKKRWANIRDQFKRCLNKRRTKDGQPVSNFKKYKFEEALQFLLPHIQEPKDPLSNVENESIIEHIQYDPESDEIERSEDETTILNTRHPTTFLSIHHHGFTSPAPPDDFTSPSTSRPIRRQLQTDNHQTTLETPPGLQQTESALMKYIINSSEKAQKEIHPIDAFFNALAATVKTFSPYHQHLAKGRIFAIVQELEFEHYVSTAPSSATQTTSVRSPSSFNSSTPTPPLPSTPTPPPSTTTITTTTTTTLLARPPR